MIQSGLEDPEGMNMTPMIDVVFNLLIFFLLGTTYVNEAQEIQLKLPTVQSAEPLTAAPDEITINVGADGRLVVAGETLSLEGLTQRLTQAKRNYPDQAVAVRGDKDARYQSVAEVIAACRKVGIARLDVLVQER